jgi:hypothetical protein
MVMTVFVKAQPEFGPGGGALSLLLFSWARLGGSLAAFHFRMVSSTSPLMRTARPGSPEPIIPQTSLCVRLPRSACIQTGLPTESS